jgi:ribonucleoside-triphosphate reductase
MKIIKRNGAEAVFDIDKIMNAVTKANNAVEETVRLTPLQIQRISEKVRITCE